jgi:hypothetical protein
MSQTDTQKLEEKSNEMRIKTIEAILQTALPDVQAALINVTVSLGTLVNILIEKKLVTADELQKKSEEISKEFADEMLKQSKPEEVKTDIKQTVSNIMTGSGLPS